LNGDGWIVTGEWPNITASPSIDCQTPGGTYGPYYHGFLQGGVFSADVSGRVFPVPNIPPGYGREVKGEKG
jgi:hypothetical protein